MIPISLACGPHPFSASYSFRLVFASGKVVLCYENLLHIRFACPPENQMEAISQRLKEFDPDMFQRFCFQLLKERNPELELKHVDGKAGDQGLDVFAGELFGEPAIWHELPDMRPRHVQAV